MSVFEEQPISNVEWILASELNPNDYNPNRVLTQEFKILLLNIARYGWIQPILINKNKMILIKLIIWRYHQINNYSSYRYIKPNGECNQSNFFMICKPF